MIEGTRQANCSNHWPLGFIWSFDQVLGPLQNEKLYLYFCLTLNQEVVGMIDDYRFGNIRIEGKSYTNDVKIIDGKVKPNWWRKEGHKLFPEDIEDILEAKPEVLVVGTGAYGAMKVVSQLRELLKEREIELIEAKSEEACHTYNQLLKAGKRIAFACHLTC